MSASIIEQSDGSSLVIVTGQDGEDRIFDIMETNGFEDLGLLGYESFHHHVVFSYSLLGDPNVDGEEITDVYECEDEYA